MTADCCTGDREGGGQRQKDSIYGDLWMVAAACLYAISNVAQEAMLKDMDTSCSEWLAGVGLSAAMLTAIQTFLLGKTQLDDTDWDSKV
eukprot:scaffold106686_cov35-Prasinocladus_malaysianus.AAC.1